MNTNNKRIHQILPRSTGAKFFFILLGGLAVFISSCHEESIVGLDVQPPGDLLNVGYEDTTTIVTRTMPEDSLHTDASVLITGDVLIGKYFDPTFGIASASLYTQLRLSSNAPIFGTNPICDSVVLALAYDPVYYGKRERVAQTANVYLLSEAISLDADYYSNNSLSYGNDLAIPNSGLGYGFIPAPGVADSVTVLGVKQKAQLRIPLQKEFGQTILYNQGMTSLASTANFQDQLCKGLYITTENTTGLSGMDGNIMHFKLGDSYSRISIYYHNSNATNNDSLKFDLTFGNVAHFSKFRHNFGSTFATPYLILQLNGTSPASNPVAYVQSLAGTKVKIEFPYLEHWKDSGAIAINKAQLVIKVDTTNMIYQLDTFAAPTKLIVFGINADGTSYAIPDVYEANQSYDGTYNSTIKEYHFNIERYIQQVIMGTRPNTGLYLVATGGAINANRVVLGGGNATGYTKMKLNLTYTKLH